MLIYSNPRNGGHLIEYYKVAILEVQIKTVLLSQPIKAIMKTLMLSNLKIAFLDKNAVLTHNLPFNIVSIFV